MISWFSRKQSSVALSTAEAEYIAACSASCEAIWIQKLMLGLFDLEMDTTEILCDNQSCIEFYLLCSRLKLGRIGGLCNQLWLVYRCSYLFYKMVFLTNILNA